MLLALLFAISLFRFHYKIGKNKCIMRLHTLLILFIWLFSFEKVFASVGDILLAAEKTKTEEYVNTFKNSFTLIGFKR